MMPEYCSPAALMVAELKASILSVSAPYLDLSDESKLLISDYPETDFRDFENAKFPFVYLYSATDATAQPANDRMEVSTDIIIGIAWKPENLDRPLDIPNTRAAARQIVRNLFDRQKSGIAAVSIYSNSDAVVSATCPDGIIACSLKFTITHLED